MACRIAFQITHQATSGGTRQATSHATSTATWSATWQATRTASYQIPRRVTKSITSQGQSLVAAHTTVQVPFRITLQATSQAPCRATWIAARRAPARATAIATTGVVLQAWKRPRCLAAAVQRPSGHLHVVADGFLTTIGFAPVETVLPWGERPGGRLGSRSCRYSSGQIGPSNGRCFFRCDALSNDSNNDRSNLRYNAANISS
jgi:hypothetical protein